MMMVSELVERIEAAVSNAEKIHFDAEIGENILSFDIVPDGIDVGKKEIVIYSNENIIRLSGVDIDYGDFDNQYILSNDMSQIIMEF